MSVLARLADPIGRTRLARAVALTVAVLAFLALAVLGLRAESGRVVAPGETARARPPPTIPSTTAPATSTTTTPAASTPVTAPSDAGNAAAPAPPATTAPTGSEPPTGPPRNPDPPSPTCPLGLPPPERTGGLASLVPLVPAFGPFTAEAFAMAPAYEPVIELFGPFVAIFGDQLVANDATLAPVIAALRQMGDAGYQQVGPLYGPYRPDVLAAMSSLAGALAPHADDLAGSAAAACLVAIEGLVASAAAEEILQWGAASVVEPHRARVIAARDR